jgi:hypothetical protein
MADRKRIRQIVGYTREEQITNAAAWFALAEAFHAAAEVLHEFQDRLSSDSRPFALNAALSLELIFKSILAQKGLTIPDGKSGHDLCSLCTTAKVRLNEKQTITLELLTETIVWAGRYPGPKDEKRWDDYQDRIFEKHVIRSSTGNVSRVLANPETFPNWKNYTKIWNGCVVEFRAAS